MHPPKGNDSIGDGVAGPRLFTVASVRGILHNPFYAGKIRHCGDIFPGVHQPLVSEELFDVVQAATAKKYPREANLDVNSSNVPKLPRIASTVYPKVHQVTTK